MRFVHRAVALGSIPFLAIGFALACSSDPASQSASSTSSTSSTSSSGSSGNNEDDASVAEARDASDAGEGGVTPRAIHVSVHTAAGAVPSGVAVSFYEDTGSRVDRAIDANGDASLLVSHPTDVTVMYALASERHFVSALRILPGESIALGSTTMRPSLGHVTGSIPTNAAYAGATSYGLGVGNCLLRGSYGNNLPSSFDFEVTNTCLAPGDTMLPVLAIAFTSGVPVAFATTTTAIPASGIVFGAADWAPATNAGAFTFSGMAPAWASAGTSTVSFLTANGSRFAQQLKGGIPGSAAFAFAGPPAAFTPKRYASIFTRASGTGASSAALHRRDDAAGDANFDWSHIPARITSFGVDANAASPTLAWVADATFPESGVGQVDMYGRVGDAGAYASWRIVFPMSGTRVTLPTLSPDLASAQPAAWEAGAISVIVGANPRVYLANPEMLPEGPHFLANAPNGEVAVSGSSFGAL